MLKFALIDDDKAELNRLSKSLESIFMQHDYDAEVKLQTTDVDTLLSYISANSIDVFILDIKLNSYMTGLQIAEKIRKTNKNCYIIFISAYFENSLIAYNYKTFDFLFKPFDSKRLEQTIIRLFDDVSNVKKQFIRIDNKNTIIAQDEIKFIEKDGMKVVFQTSNRKYEVYSSFSKIEKILPDTFVRCHKSFIANIDNITEVEPSENTVFFDNLSCEIGPKYKSKFLEVINKYGYTK